MRYPCRRTLEKWFAGREKSGHFRIYVERFRHYCHTHAFTKLRSLLAPQAHDGARLQPVEVQQRGLLPEETLGVVAAGGLRAKHLAHIEWPLNSLQPTHSNWSHTPTGMVGVLEDLSMNHVRSRCQWLTTQKQKLPCSYSKTTPPVSGELWVMTPAVPCQPP